MTLHYKDAQVKGNIYFQKTYPNYQFSVYVKFYYVLTGTGTKFVAYLSLPATLFKHEINIYWPIIMKKVTNDEYSLYFNNLT